MISHGISHQWIYPHQTCHLPTQNAQLQNCFNVLNSQTKYMKKQIQLVLVPTDLIFTCKVMILIILGFVCCSLLTLAWIAVKYMISPSGWDGVNFLRKFSWFCSSYCLPRPAESLATNQGYPTALLYSWIWNAVWKTLFLRSQEQWIDFWYLS